MSITDQLRLAIDAANLWEKGIALKRNEYLKKKDTIDTNIYFVATGALRIFVDDGFEEQTIRFGYKDNLIAALDSFLTEQPSTLYIQAIKASTLQVVTKNNFQALINGTDELKQLWTQLLEGFVVQQMEREMDLLTSSPNDRYERVLARSPRLFQEVPHKYIASYLRMTPETLSRLKKS
ncbi:Crp/Fnr family transcriptional regulator [Fulvivirga sp. RKSG066]|uniref:Crp/Fnr family transcriptional regulator n=1 Tax=Fulvivirga aurantia TaxID=2529383 RepID=UPI0012BD6CD1|nr:Crp/Fnr family transcriptional regulator [Fulvivirga aurantia]MTI21538.1 Crp/Fnr family transcriptional regulator [Fulvivirga aurantia]